MRRRWATAQPQQGYTHGANDQANAIVACGYSGNPNWNFQVNTIPYIVQGCITDVIQTSGTTCGAPLENGKGLNITTAYQGPTCAIAYDPQNPNVNWTLAGTPIATEDLPNPIGIAGCTNGKLYGLDSDGSIWVNSNGGDNSSWGLVTASSPAAHLMCADTLYRFDTNRSLWRNDGTDRSPSWTLLGNPTATRQVAVTQRQGEGAPGFVLFYGLNDDGTLWTSNSGADSDWTEVNPSVGGTDRIVAAGTDLGSRLFALNYDKTLSYNWGEGCGANWIQLDTVPSTVEIAATTYTTMYALNSDGSLWRGDIQGTDAMISTFVGTGKARTCVNGTLQ
jgi:hypothetical protein